MLTSALAAVTPNAWHLASALQVPRSGQPFGTRPGRTDSTKAYLAAAETCVGGGQVTQDCLVVLTAGCGATVPEH